MIKQIIFDKVTEAINQAIKAGNLGQLNADAACDIAVEKTRNPEFGDYAVNVSPMARHAKISPPKIAEAIVSYIDLQDTEINVINGFINFKLGNSWLNNTIQKIITKNKDYGKNNLGNSEKVLLEYVSANPTGPLHIGHGRWAAVGSSLSNLLGFCGYKVDQEFYINDAGRQIICLYESLLIRILELKGGEQRIPTDDTGVKNYYPGEYLVDLAQKYIEENPEKANEIYKVYQNVKYIQNLGRYSFNFTKSDLEKYIFSNSGEIMDDLRNFAVSNMLEEQKELLKKIRVHFDTWYSETSLHESGEVEKTIETLKSRDELYNKEDALWFKSSQYGDDQDRVIIKSDGSYTYLTADIAYHYDKLKRGYDKLINIWGADHHGYVARIKAAIEALGDDSNKLEVLLGQLVNLIISGEQVRMGKRRKMLTLEELIDEVGVDATRYWMVMRSIDTTLDFDVDLAKSCSDENPVYYVQYAHARSCSIMRTATSERMDQDTRTTMPPYITQEDLNDLVNSEKFNPSVLGALWNTDNQKELESTKALILKLESFQDLVLSAAKSRAPYQISRYIQELASDFHYFYTFTRVLNVEEPAMRARLCLIHATKQVLHNALNLLGVNAPESM